MVTASMISRIFTGSAMRATPPWARMSEGTRSSAMTATAPASSAMTACSALVTSMMTPPFSISASPTLVRQVDFSMSRCSGDPPSAFSFQLIASFQCFQRLLNGGTGAAGGVAAHAPQLDAGGAPTDEIIEDRRTAGGEPAGGGNPRPQRPAPPPRDQPDPLPREGPP